MRRRETQRHDDQLALTLILTLTPTPTPTLTRYRHEPCNACAPLDDGEPARREGGCVARLRALWREGALLGLGRASGEAQGDLMTVGARPTECGVASA